VSGAWRGVKVCNVRKLKTKDLKKSAEEVGREE